LEGANDIQQHPITSNCLLLWSSRLRAPVRDVAIKQVGTFFAWRPVAVKDVENLGRPLPSLEIFFTKGWRISWVLVTIQDVMHVVNEELCAMMLMHFIRQ
jgi:hypothetical protein